MQLSSLITFQELDPWTIHSKTYLDLPYVMKNMKQSSSSDNKSIRSVNQK